MKRVISTETAPLAIGPYSQAIESDGLIFISGQLPLIPGEGVLATGIEAQARQSLTNIKSILESQGLTMANIIKTTIFVTNLADYKTVNDVYATFFTDAYPARSAIQVAALPLGAELEIEAIAKA